MSLLVIKAFSLILLNVLSTEFILSIFAYPSCIFIVGAFHIQSSSEEEEAIVGDLFLRREEFVVQPHVPEEREQPEEHPQPEQRRQPGHQQPEDQQPGAENQPGRARCTCDR